MKKFIKKTFSATAALLFVTTATVFAQQSDYQIQQNFRAEYNTLLERVQNAATPGELEELASDIDALEASYSEFSSIIDAALYPETMNDRISSLRSRYTTNLNNLQVLEDSD